jgi:hypothetical protein
VRPEIPTINGIEQSAKLPDWADLRRNPDDIQKRGIVPLGEVLEELERADSLFPRPFINYAEAIETVSEEVDELHEECRKNPAKRNRAMIRKEAIQAAAMILRFLRDCCPKQEGG